MDNKTVLSDNYFILKEDGKIYWIEKMPEHWYSDSPFKEFSPMYQEALQSAIDSAVEVSNQEDLLTRVKRRMGNPFRNYELEPGKVYSLLCSVSTDIFNTKALVTFSKPEPSPNEQELWDNVLDITGVYYPATVARTKVVQELSERFTITRKK